MKIKCESCGEVMKWWNLAENCILYKCPKCSHIIRNLRDCKTCIREEVYGGYEKFDLLRLLLTKRRILELLNTRGKEILEVGCGSGILLNTLHQMGYKVWGTEIDGMKDKIIAQIKTAVSFGCAEEIDFPEEKFDLIYAIHVVEHLKEPSKVFRKIYNSLKTNGVLYLVTPNGLSKGLNIFKDKWWFLEDPTHLRFFSPSSIRHILKNCGFQNIKVKPLIFDSFTFEINSLMKSFFRKGPVMEKKIVKVLDLLLGPFPVIFRIFYPKVSPSMEVIAWKVNL